MQNNAAPQKSQKKKLIRYLIWLSIIACIGMNIVAYNHAYTFTHFTDKEVKKTKDAQHLSAIEKIQILFFGINNPRPVNTFVPKQAFETILLHNDQSIELWQIHTAGKPKGTVILFHGYSGCKSGLLDKSDEFLQLGYNTLLVDFPGSGGSAGNQTTIGFKEAAVVKSCYEYLQQSGEKTIYLFGTSMGAVAILKAIHDYAIHPAGLILECPFGTMYETTVKRFHTMHVPEFPFAPLLVFWGGLQNGFWAFSHNPVNYARQVHCPTLLMYGELDEKVSMQEINTIYQNLQGAKHLITFKKSGHENYLIKHQHEWLTAVSGFLSNYSSTQPILSITYTQGNFIQFP